jgi:multidrug efflux system outer membrane protein
LQNARAQYEETVNRYRAQVLTAFQEVENALVDLHTLASQANAQEVAVTAARRALELSQQQYEKGAVSFLDVLDAERTLLQDERVSAQLLGARMSDPTSAVC